MAYEVPASVTGQGLQVIPLLGVGRGNPLNRALCALLAVARTQIIISTPYFNPPQVVMRELDHALARGLGWS